MLNNTANTFGTISKLFHWVIALFIIGMLILGTVMSFSHQQTFQTLMFFHQSIGVTVLILMVLRFIWRLCSITPSYPDSMNTMEQRLAHAMAWLLYLLIFAILLTGMFMTTFHGYGIKFWGLSIHLPVTPSKNAAHVLAGIHEFLAWSIATCVVIHIAASFYHHHVKKDDILKRMM